MSDSPQAAPPRHPAATRPAESSRASLLDWRGVVPVVAATHAVVGLSLAGRSSLWGDEAFTAESVRLPLTQLLPMLERIDVNMSAYYLAVKAWSAALGHDELALRSFSLVCTTATVVVGGLLVSRWFGRRAGAAAALLLGLNPLILLLGITARPFAMLGLATTLAVAAYVRALGTRRIPPWLLVAGVDVLALYVSLLAALVIATQAALLLPLERRIGREHLLAAAVVVLGAVPSAIYLAPRNTLAWLSRPTLRQLAEIGWQAGGRTFFVVLAVAACCGLARPEPIRTADALGSRSRWILPAFTLGPLALMLALLPLQSLFTPSYLVGVVVAASLLGGAGVGSLHARVQAVGVPAGLLVAVVALAMGPVRTPALDPQDWRDLMPAVLRAASPGDSVVFPNTYYRIAGEHYARSTSITDLDPRLPAVPWFSSPPDTYDAIKRTGQYDDPGSVVSGVRGERRVWLVGPADAFMAEFTTALQRHGWTTRDEIRASGLLARLVAAPSG